MLAIIAFFLSVLANYFRAFLDGCPGDLVHSSGNQAKIVLTVGIAPPFGSVWGHSLTCFIF
jgi:hypothetical protein